MSFYFPSASMVSTGFQLLSAFLLLLLLQAHVDAQNGGCDEVCTLFSFKGTNNHFPDPENRLPWRESDESACAWVGVVCTANSTVMELNLSGWGWHIGGNSTLGGLSNLRDLQILDLSSNYLGPGAGEGIGNLTGLTLLNLSSTGLDIFPGVGNLTGLSLLDLSRNYMTGAIPTWISGCLNLRSLSLQNNILTGAIPSLKDLRKLQILLLADNVFTGSFPLKLGELTSLVTLDLSGNSLSGVIPSLRNLTELASMTLDNNGFVSFDSDWFLGANFSLSQVSVSFNFLSGLIPSSLTELSKLTKLNMSGNSLSGPIPYGFSHLLSNGHSLDLSRNNLTGDIPTDLLQLEQSGENCALLNLSHNGLSGAIPALAGNSAGNNSMCFLAIDFSHNQLRGPVPWSSVGDDESHIRIQDLWLQDNQLSGDIVNILVNSRLNTTEMHLQDNLFTGDLSRIADLSPLGLQFEVLDLSNNNLRWTVSEQFPDPIQATLRKLPSTLTKFQAGRNNFTGTSLPRTCFADEAHPMYGLQFLDLSHSYLNGEISDVAFQSSCLPGLQYLNLSNNLVSGPVPESLVTLPHLAVLDVSYNRLSGPLPSLPFNSTLTNSASYVGNDGLCGYASNPCLLEGGSTGLTSWVLVAIIVGPLSLALVSFAVATWRWKVYRKLHQQDEDLIKTLMERESATLMSLRELRKATDNFAGSAQIGQGGFGTVYIGKLDNGTTVAIKKSKREGTENDKQQFLNEVRILSQVTHRNLVKLMGCCMENRTAVLVFEFISNGTLQEHLQGQIGPTRLTWKERLNVAVQTADALNYLHTAAMFPIYHRDVKSANILLTEDLNAKVADFGISRLAPLQVTHVSTAAVQGTMGYIDPEYYTSYQLTDRSDVYSFGVVLLELISAKPALDFGRGGDETSLVNFASPCIEREDLEGLLDPALMETYTDLAGHGRESILNVGRLALTCLAMRSKARPSMSEVLKELQSLSFDFNGAPTDLDSVKSDDDQGALSDCKIFLAGSSYGDSSSITIDETMGSEFFSIQLSHFSSPASFK